MYGGGTEFLESIMIDYWRMRCARLAFTCRFSEDNSSNYVSKHDIILVSIVAAL